MFCQNCGFNLDNNAAFCPNCGTAAPKPEAAAPIAAPVATPAPEQTYAAPQPTYAAPEQSYTAPQPTYTAPQQVFTGYAANPVTARFNSVFSDVLFLIVCIFVSVYTLFASFVTTTNAYGYTSTEFSVNIFGILFTIFTWMAYASAKKGNINIKAIRGISGTILALSIVLWVAIGIFGVCGLLLIAAGDAVGDDLMSELVSTINIDAELIYNLGIRSIEEIFIFFGVLFLLVAGIFALFNILFIGKLHKFAKSIYTSAQTGYENVAKAKSVSTWLLVVGILSAIGSFSGGFTGFLSGAGLAAAYIVLFVWIKKHFVAPTQIYTAPPQNYVG